MQDNFTDHPGMRHVSAALNCESVIKQDQEVFSLNDYFNISWVCKLHSTLPLSALLFSFHGSENLIIVVSSPALHKTSQGEWVSLLA